MELKPFEKEAEDIHLKMIGRYKTIDYNKIGNQFYEELSKTGININEFIELMDKVTAYFAKEYKENEEIREETNNIFIKETIDEMKRMIEIAENIGIKEV